MCGQFIIASYQGPPANSLGHALEIVQSVCKCTSFADIILFPEAFLQGYMADEHQTKKSAIDLSCTNIFATLIDLKPTIILGLNEKFEDQIYNTAVVINSGKVIGKTRKFSTYRPYDYYSLSDDFPVFKKNNVCYGISICCDINYKKPAEILAKRGAQIIFVPMWNIVGRMHSLLPHMHNKAHLQAKAVENKVWLVCSDVIDSTETHMGVGASCIIDPQGTIVCVGQPLTANILCYNISRFSLDKKYVGLDREKQEQLINTYSK